MKLEKGEKVNLKSQWLAFCALVMLSMAIIASAGTVTATDEKKVGELLISIEGMQQPSLSPNWEKVAFLSNGAFYVANVDGSNRRQIPGPSNPPYGDSAIYAWSRDSEKIAYVNDEGFWIVNADGSNNYRIAANPRINNILWSPSGTWIYYSTDDRDGYIINSDGTNNIRIGFSESPISWTYDEKILIMSGGNLLKVSENGFVEDQLSFYPIRETLGFTSYDKIEDVAANADGSKIAFRFAGRGAYVVNFDGSNLQELPVSYGCCIYSCFLSFALAIKKRLGTDLLHD